MREARDGQVRELRQMSLTGELTRREERVHVVQRLPQQSAGTPELRRAMIGQLTAETFLLGARLAIEFEQHVRRANQPVLVQRVQFGRLAQPQNARAADERDVVEMDHIESF